tara:strand:- start:9 stop:368 length:360 start_codon:yes stop_codon:yes gene_type:complete
MDRKQFMIVLILVVVASFLSSAVIQFFNGHANAETSNNLGHITTKGIVLVGEDGKVRANFYLGNHDAPQLIFYDKDGTNRFNVGLAPSGNAGMSFNDENFKKLIDLDTKHGRASISVKK